MLMIIFVGHLDKSVRGFDVRKLFEKYGTVSWGKVIYDKGLFRGFGFVEMPDQEEAKKAIANLHKSEFQGNIITVEKTWEKIEVNIVIKNFPNTYSSYEIKTLFKKHGSVKRVNMHPDKQEATVTMTYLHQAQEAVKKLDGVKLINQSISVKLVN